MGRLYRFGFHSFRMIAVSNCAMDGTGRRKMLVESLGHLHLVVRYPLRGDESKNIKLRVYKYIEWDRKWVHVRSLGDQVFFMGHDFSFSLSARDLQSSCRGNCIFFRTYNFYMYYGNDRDRYFFENKISDGLQVGVFHLDDGGSFGLVASFPDYSEIWWPPPDWLRTLKLSGIKQSNRHALQAVERSGEDTEKWRRTQSRTSKGNNRDDTLDIQTPWDIQTCCNSA